MGGQPVVQVLQVARAAFVRDTQQIWEWTGSATTNRVGSRKKSRRLGREHTKEGKK